MGIIVTANGCEISFPRRLLRELASFSVALGQASEPWERIILRFDAGGACLELWELPEGEIIALRSGIELLEMNLSGRDEFGGFSAGEVSLILKKLKIHLVQ